jgi:endonuclease-8
VPDWRRSLGAGSGWRVPEGDTVYLAAKRLHACLAGQRIDGSDFRLPTLANLDLTGVGVREVRPYGKHLLFRFDDNRTLHTHFRMDGSWHIYRQGQRWSGGPLHSVRVIVSSRIYTCVGYRLHDVTMLQTADEHLVIGHLGPDILNDHFDEGLALENIRSQGKRAIGDALVDQRVLAGIGNIYRCESLFVTGIAPATPTSSLGRDQCANLVATARTLMMRNRDRASQSTTGDEQRAHFVYGRARQSCRRCHETIATMTGEARPNAQTIFWCPGCQSHT